MNKAELSKILELHKKWLNNEEGGVKANLREADLRCADLREANLEGANLEGADLRRADLREANLEWADLRRADLEGAYLRGADLRGANLRWADLREANLRWADLREANLEWADLRRADLEWANLDYSCLPLWCGSLLANMDDRQVKQILYHLLSIIKHSNNVSDSIKEKLLTEENLEIAREFHRSEECKKL